MAKQKQSSRGSTFYGIIIGLVGGLAAAAAVAYFVMSSPMPFVDKASRSDSVVTTDPRTAPDPNAGLSGQTAPVKPRDELGDLIATLPVDGGKRVPALPEAPRPSPVAPVVPARPAEDARPYYLQVGAFRVLEDAEALQARMVLMGLPVQIQRAQVNGVLVNRVRVGPYARLDDMNKARSRLSEEKISSNIVRQ